MFSPEAVNSLCDVIAVTVDHARELLEATNGDIEAAIGLHFTSSLDEFPVNVPDVDFPQPLQPSVLPRNNHIGAITRDAKPRPKPIRTTAPLGQPVLYPRLPEPPSPVFVPNGLNVMFLNKTCLEFVYFRRNKTMLFDLEENVEKVRFFFRNYQRTGHSEEYGTPDWLDAVKKDGTLKSTVLPGLTRTFGMLHTYKQVVSDLKRMTHLFLHICLSAVHLCLIQLPLRVLCSCRFCTLEEFG